MKRAVRLEDTLPIGVRSRMVENINGLSMHVLEAGFESEGRPAIVLLHGFPELAYSWRRIMPSLAAAGFHVIVPAAEPRARHSGARCGVRIQVHRNCCRARLRLNGRRFLRADPARRLSF